MPSAGCSGAPLVAHRPGACDETWPSHRERGAKIVGCRSLAAACCCSPSARRIRRSPAASSTSTTSSTRKRSPTSGRTSPQPGCGGQLQPPGHGHPLPGDAPQRGAGERAGERDESVPRRAKMNPSPGPARVRRGHRQGHAAFTSAAGAAAQGRRALYTLGVAYGLRANYNFLVRKAWMDSLRDATTARKLHNRVTELIPPWSTRG